MDFEPPSPQFKDNEKQSKDEIIMRDPEMTVSFGGKEENKK